MHQEITWHQEFHWCLKKFLYASIRAVHRIDLFDAIRIMMFLYDSMFIRCDIAILSSYFMIWWEGNFEKSVMCTIYGVPISFVYKIINIHPIMKSFMMKIEKYQNFLLSQPLKTALCQSIFSITINPMLEMNNITMGRHVFSGYFFII